MARAMTDKAIMGTMMGPPFMMSEMNIPYLLTCLPCPTQACAGRDEKIGQSKLPYVKIKVPGRGIKPWTRDFQSNMEIRAINKKNK
jgi:hypothetical protein